jgi:hypothetical protein
VLSLGRVDDAPGRGLRTALAAPAPTGSAAT